jgi:hypothetical protein
MVPPLKPCTSNFKKITPLQHFLEASQELLVAAYLIHSE